MNRNKNNDNHVALLERTLRIELFLSHVLRWGVIVSFAIVAVGIGAVVVGGRTGYHEIQLNDINSIVQYRVPPDFPNTLAEVWSGLLALKPYAVITLGLIVLITIPILRVAVSIVAFAVERDWLYTLITSFVLFVLLLSYAIGTAGG